MTIVSQLRALLRLDGGDKDIERCVSALRQLVKLRDGGLVGFAEYLREQIQLMALEIGQYQGIALERFVGRMESYARMADFIESLDREIEDLSEEIRRIEKKRGGVTNVGA